MGAIPALPLGILFEFVFYFVNLIRNGKLIRKIIYNKHYYSLNFTYTFNHGTCNCKVSNGNLFWNSVTLMRKKYLYCHVYVILCHVEQFFIFGVGDLNIMKNWNTMFKLSLQF